MKKVFRNFIMLSALLLLALMVKATVIGGGTATNPTTGNEDYGSVAGCEDKSKKLKKLNCKTKDGGPAYGCSNLGTLEDCTVAQSCP